MGEAWGCFNKNDALLDVSGHPEGNVPTLCFPPETYQDYTEKLGFCLSENLLRLHGERPIS